MAEELKIKVRVDSSDVSRGTDEAKNKVKQAADSMKSNAANAASSMKASMDSVAKSTASIGDAAKSAESAVKEMDRGVAQSAASMEKNLASVRRQMSAMQLFHMGARGVSIVGGIAEDIAKLNGATGTAEAIGSATNIVGTGLQGAAIGWAVGGPWGAAIGGLVGAGKGLLDAAVKQKEAAEKQLEATNASIRQSKQSIEDIDKDFLRRQRIERAQTIANMPEGAFDEKFAQSEIDKAQRALWKAKNRQEAVQNMLYGRRGYETVIEDWGAIAFNAPGAAYVAMPNGSMVDLKKDMPQSLGTINWMDPNHEDMVSKMIDEAIQRRAVKPTLENIFTNEKDEYGNNKGDSSFYYAMNSILDFLRIRPDQSGQILKNVTANIFKTLEQQSIEAAQAVQEAQARLDELAPIQARLDKERAASEARMNAPLNFEDWGPFDQEGPTDSGWFDIASEAAKRREAAELELASGTDLMKTLQSRLAGIYSLAASPTDALTKIGGGVGYTSYNNSVLTVTKSIEKSLNTLIQNQLRQNEEIKQEIENLKFIEGTTWQ